MSAGDLRVRHDDRSDHHENNDESNKYAGQKVLHVSLVTNRSEHFHGPNPDVSLAPVLSRPRHKTARCVLNAA